MTAPIVLLANSTSWDDRNNGLVPGGQADRYLRPILNALPAGTAEIRRHPSPGPYVNTYMNHRDIYRPDSWLRERASLLISHGIASKTYRNAVNAKTYSHIVVPGPSLAGEVVASGVPSSKVHQCGYPKLDPIHRGEVASPWPERDGRARVLWAPTHGGGSERYPQGNRQAPGAGATTWWARDEMLALLDPDRFLVLEAPHPRHHPQRQATLAEYVGADVVIADGGSTIYESWCVGLPVVLPDWICAEQNLARADGATQEARVYREQLGWHAASAAELADLVAAAAEHGITDAEREFAEHVLPTEYRGHGGKLHAELLLEIEQATRPAPRPAQPTRTGPSMKFVSTRYPQLQVPAARIRFRNGEASTDNPDAIAVLNSPQLRAMGVEPVGEDAPAEPTAETPAAEAAPQVEAAGAEPADAETPDQADTEEPAVDLGGVPTGGAKEVLAWVGDDAGRARQALEVEQARDKPRTTLAAALTKLAG